MKRILFLMALGLAGCGLSEKQCEQGDWFGLGLKDGRQGHPAERLDRHAKSCSEFGILPDRALWEEGRQQGLKSYCTAENAYRIGRQGFTFRPSCPEIDQPVLNAAYRKGERYHELTQEIEALEREIDEIREDIAAAAANPARLTKYNQSDINFKRFRIFMLESERQRFATL